MILRDFNIFYVDKKRPLLYNLLAIGGMARQSVADACIANERIGATYPSTNNFI